MDISASSISAMTQLEFQAELSTKVTRKALDTVEAQGEQMIEMLEAIPQASASPMATSGLKIDIMA